MTSGHLPLLAHQPTNLTGLGDCWVMTTVTASSSQQRISPSLCPAVYSRIPHQGLSSPLPESLLSVMGAADTVRCLAPPSLLMRLAECLSFSGSRFLQPPNGQSGSCLCLTDVSGSCREWEALQSPSLLGGALQVP